MNAALRRKIMHHLGIPVITEEMLDEVEAHLLTVARATA